MSSFCIFQVTARFRLKPGTYLIVPSTYEPGVYLINILLEKSGENEPGFCLWWKWTDSQIMQPLLNQVSRVSSCSGRLRRSQTKATSCDCLSKTKKTSFAKINFPLYFLRHKLLIWCCGAGGGQGGRQRDGQGVGNSCNAKNSLVLSLALSLALSLSLAPPSVWHWWSRTMDMDNKGDWELKVVRLTRRKTKSWGWWWGWNWR